MRPRSRLEGIIIEASRLRQARANRVDTPRVPIVVHRPREGAGDGLAKPMTITAILGLWPSRGSSHRVGRTGWSSKLPRLQWLLDERANGRGGFIGESVDDPVIVR